MIWLSVLGIGTTKEHLANITPGLHLFNGNSFGSHCLVLLVFVSRFRTLDLVLGEENFTLLTVISCGLGRSAVRHTLPLMTRCSGSLILCGVCCLTVLPAADGLAERG